MKQKLLIVDYDEEIRTQMRWALTEDYAVLEAKDRATALEIFRIERPAVVLLDLGLPPHADTPEDGLATLAEILGLERTTKVIIVSGQTEKTAALEAVGAGAYDFVGKPVDMVELRALLKRGFHLAQLEREYRALQQRLQTDNFEGLLGDSAPVRVVFGLVRKVATSDASVLILGESGTGKEMTARAIHQCSARREGPFIAINCSAIPESLIESELFGHERGAFTGAHVQRKGRIELAAQGTLFLDEIGEVPLTIQVKLLRFLQDQRIERVGGRQEIAVDARVIAATNANLKKALEAGTFREDLFYRLAVVQIALPALRDREDDIVLLARAFLQRFAIDSHKRDLTFSPEALRALREHSWPGNVRELQNRVKRAVIMSEGKRLTAEDLELHDSGETQLSTLKEARESFERELVQRSLRKHGGRITATALELGISRPTLYELIDKLGVERPPTLNAHPDASARV